MRRQPNLVLLHSPLVGSSAWQPVARVLESRRHSTTVPSLTGSATGAGPYYPKIAAAVADEIVRHTEGPVVLVAHSGAGALLPAVAHAVAARFTPLTEPSSVTPATESTTVVGMVFVDALLPHPGRAWFDTVPAEMREQMGALSHNGILQPWNEWFPPNALEELLPDPAMRARFCDELPRLPLAYFEEPAPQCRGPLPSNRAYLQLSAAYSDAADQAERAGWHVTRRHTDHLAILTEPENVGAALETLTQNFPV